MGMYVGLSDKELNVEEWTEDCFKGQIVKDIFYYCFSFNDGDENYFDTDPDSEEHVLRPTIESLALALEKFSYDEYAVKFIQAMIDNPLLGIYVSP